MQIIIVVSACLVFAVCFTIFIKDIKKKKATPYTPNTEQPTSENINVKSQEENTVIGSIISSLGFITIVAGIITAIHFENVVFALGGIVSGILFLGVGEIISLLYKIYRKIQ